MVKTIEEGYFILNPIRWNIIECIIKGTKKAAEIAKETGKSIAFIGQQLALLEAKGFIKEEASKKDKNRGLGKPAKNYEIAKESNTIICIGKERICAQTIPSTQIDKYRLSSLMTKHNDDLYFLQKLYYTHNDFFNSIQAASIVESTENEIHLFIIGTDIEQIRQEKSSITMTSPIGQTKTFILWTHTIEEVQEGLKNKETYFIEKIKKSDPIWSDGQINLFDLKRELEEIQGKTYKN